MSPLTVQVIWLTSVLGLESPFVKFIKILAMFISLNF